MNTVNVHRTPLLKEGRTRDYEFILEDLELAFPKKQLNEITKDWEAGMDIEFIAKKHKRHVEEVFLALFHQSRNEKIKRPFAYRK